MTSLTVPVPAPKPSTDDAFAAFEAALRGSGPRAALAYLVGLTSYCFIGIFRFSGGMANAAIHCDRENPEVTRIDAVPESATYCCFVRDRRGSFTTAGAASRPSTRSKTRASRSTWHERRCGPTAACR